MEVLNLFFQEHAGAMHVFSIKRKKKWHEITSWLHRDARLAGPATGVHYGLMDLEGMAAVYPSLSPHAELSSDEIYSGARRRARALENSVFALEPDEPESGYNRGICLLGEPGHARLCQLWPPVR